MKRYRIDKRGLKVGIYGYRKLSFSLFSVGEGSNRFTFQSYDLRIIVVGVVEKSERRCTENYLVAVTLRILVPHIELDVRLHYSSTLLINGDLVVEIVTNKFIVACHDVVFIGKRIERHVEFHIAPVDNARLSAAVCRVVTVPDRTETVVKIYLSLIRVASLICAVDLIVVHDIGFVGYAITAVIFQHLSVRISDSPIVVVTFYINIGQRAVHQVESDVYFIVNGKRQYRFDYVVNYSVQQIFYCAFQCPGSYACRIVFNELVDYLIKFVAQR